MHGYYQKNLKKWHKTLNSYMNYISYELESLTGQSYDTLIQEIWTNYQAEMLERFPYIGGDAASGTKNLIGAYMFVSMGEVLHRNIRFLQHPLPSAHCTFLTICLLILNGSA